MRWCIGTAYAVLMTIRRNRPTSTLKWCTQDHSRRARVWRCPVHRARLNYGFEKSTGAATFVLGVDYVRDRNLAIERLTVDAVYAKEFSTNFKGLHRA